MTGIVKLQTKNVSCVAGSVVVIGVVPTTTPVAGGSI
jgi:hypothetical protein